MAVAAYGCSLLDRETTDKAAVAAEIESLKRWSAAHVHDPRFKNWVVFRFPENLDYYHLVQVQRPDPAIPEEMVGPDGKLRRREEIGRASCRERVEIEVGAEEGNREDGRSGP